MDWKRALVACIASVALAGLAMCQGTAIVPSPSVARTSAPTATFVASPTPLPTAIPTLAPGVVLTRGPYLQSVTTSSVIVVWETGQPSEGAVAFGKTSDYGSSVADPVMRTRHAVTLTGLEPYTTYHYRIQNGAALSKDMTFRSAAGPEQAQFTFAVLGDTQTAQVHQAVVDRIVALEPDFVLHTGDLVNLGSVLPYWEDFFEIERELMARAPLFPTLGNHDCDAPHYFDNFHLPGNERWYAFDYGNARFVCLQVDGFTDFSPQSQQYVWLEETLAANSRPWLFVYFHIPPYTSSSDTREGGIRRVLSPLFERYGVDVVFSGHHHNYERNEVNGTTYIVTGGGGGGPSVMEEREPTQAAFAVMYHCVYLEIDGQHLRATAISPEGNVLDTFERSAE